MKGSDVCTIRHEGDVANDNSIEVIEGAHVFVTTGTGRIHDGKLVEQVGHFGQLNCLFFLRLVSMGHVGAPGDVMLK